MRFGNWNIVQFTLDNTPSKRQTSIMLVWLGVLLKPLNTIYTAFKSYYLGVYSQLSYNSQTIILEKLLNNTFDSILNRIYIVHSNDTNMIGYIYFNSEAAPKTYASFISEGKPLIYGYFKSEAKGATDFYVNVPASLTYDAVLMNSLIKKYKLISKRYIIQLI